MWFPVTGSALGKQNGLGKSTLCKILQNTRIFFNCNTMQTWPIQNEQKPKAAQALQNTTVQIRSWLRTQRCGTVVLQRGRGMKIMFIAFNHRLVRNDTAACNHRHWVTPGHQSPQPPPVQNMNRRKELPRTAPGRSTVPKCSLDRLHQPRQHFSHPWLSECCSLLILYPPLSLKFIILLCHLILFLGQRHKVPWHTMLVPFIREHL